MVMYKAYFYYVDSKGDVLNTGEARRVVTDYIKRKGLQKEGQR